MSSIKNKSIRVRVTDEVHEYLSVVAANNKTSLSDVVCQIFEKQMAGTNNDEALKTINKKLNILTEFNTKYIQTYSANNETLLKGLRTIVSNQGK